MYQANFIPCAQLLSYSEKLIFATTATHKHPRSVLTARLFQIYIFRYIKYIKHF